MNPYDDLDRALRGGPDPADRRLAGAIRRLRGAGNGAVPPASEGLAAFLAAAESGAGELTDKGELPVTAASNVHGPVVIQVAGLPKRRSTMKSSLLVPFERVAKLGLLAKVMLGATVALGSAGAVAATGALPDAGNDTVVTVPAAGSEEPGGDALPVVEDDHEGRGHADVEPDDDGPDPEPDDEPDEEPDDEPDDEPEDEPEDDDQGEDDDDQGEDDDDRDEPDHDEDESDDDHEDGDHEDESDDDHESEDHESDDHEESDDHSGGDDGELDD